LPRLRDGGAPGAVHGVLFARGRCEIECRHLKNIL
jgi:hypothetical protein